MAKLKRYVLALMLLASVAMVWDVARGRTRRVDVPKSSIGVSSLYATLKTHGPMHRYLGDADGLVVVLNPTGADSEAYVPLMREIVRASRGGWWESLLWFRPKRTRVVFAGSDPGSVAKFLLDHGIRGEVVPTRMPFRAGAPPLWVGYGSRDMHMWHGVLTEKDRLQVLKLFQ